MVAKNEMCYTDCVDKVIDHAMTKLFQLAEYICGRRPLKHELTSFVLELLDRIVTLFKDFRKSVNRRVKRRLERLHFFALLLDLDPPL